MTSTIHRRAVELRDLLEPAFAPDTALGGVGSPAATRSAGHCAAVALIARVVFGGELVSAKCQGESHWFNRLSEEADEFDVDLTGDQFGGSRVQVQRGGHLYPGARLRHMAEVAPETLDRAVRLAERAGLNRVAAELRASGKSPKRPEGRNT